MSCRSEHLQQPKIGIGVDSEDEAHRNLAYILCWDARDWSGSEREFKQALRLDPSDHALIIGTLHFLPAKGGWRRLSLRANEDSNLIRSPLVPITTTLQA